MLPAVSMDSQAQERKAIRVAAAADLKFAMVELTKEFDRQAGIKLDVIYGSSGNFYSQIQTGAPFDLFFSADMEYPEKLEVAGLAEAGTLCEYALGKIVLWMPENSPLDLAKLGWKALLDASVKKIAIANPVHAPYGRAAIAALKNAGVYQSVKDKLVFGENISQAAQFVQSGNAEAGILALSLAVSPSMRNGKTWEIPAEMYPAIRQGAVVLKSGGNKEAARSFLKFVQSPSGRTVFQKYGFAAPLAESVERRFPGTQAANSD